MAEWKSFNEVVRSPSAWGSVLQLFGTVFIAVGFSIGAAEGVRFRGIPAANVSVNSPVLFYGGWFLLALGFLFEIVAAIRKSN